MQDADDTRADDQLPKLEQPSRSAPGLPNTTDVPKLIQSQDFSSFADIVNLDSCILHIQSRLRGLGFYQRVDFTSSDPEHVALRLNCIHALLSLRQSEVDAKSRLDADARKLRTEIAALERNTSKLEGQLYQKDRDIGILQNKSQQEQQQLRRDLAKAKQEAEDASRRAAALQQREVHLRHDLRRKEAATEKLQARLRVLVQDKKGEARASMQIAGAFQQQQVAANSGPAAGAGGAKASTSRRPASRVDHEDLHRRIIEAYEAKVAGLQADNRALTRSLSELQEDHKLLLNQLAPSYSPLSSPSGSPYAAPNRPHTLPPGSAHAAPTRPQTSPAAASAHPTVPSPLDEEEAARQLALRVDQLQHRAKQLLKGEQQVGATQEGNTAQELAAAKQLLAQQEQALAEAFRMLQRPGHHPPLPHPHLDPNPLNPDPSTWSWTSDSSDPPPIRTHLNPNPLAIPSSTPPPHHPPTTRQHTHDQHPLNHPSTSPHSTHPPLGPHNLSPPNQHPLPRLIDEHREQAPTSHLDPATQQAPEWTSCLQEPAWSSTPVVARQPTVNQPAPAPWDDPAAWDATGQEASAGDLSFAEQHLQLLDESPAAAQESQQLLPSALWPSDIAPSRSPSTSQASTTNSRRQLQPTIAQLAEHRGASPTVASLAAEKHTDCSLLPRTATPSSPLPPAATPPSRSRAAADRRALALQQQAFADALQALQPCRHQAPASRSPAKSATAGVLQQLCCFYPSRELPPMGRLPHAAQPSEAAVASNPPSASDTSSTLRHHQQQQQALHQGEVTQQQQQQQQQWEPQWPESGGTAAGHTSAGVGSFGALTVVPPDSVAGGQAVVGQASGPAQQQAVPAGAGEGFKPQRRMWGD